MLGRLWLHWCNVCLDCWDRRERLCEVMHDAYEDAAVENGWRTQDASRVPWEDVPEANRRTMRAAVDALLRELDRD